MCMRHPGIPWCFVAETWLDEIAAARQRLTISVEPSWDLDLSMDWFKGQFTGNHGFYHSIWDNMGFSCKFPLNQLQKIVILQTLEVSPEFPRDLS